MMKLAITYTPEKLKSGPILLRDVSFAQACGYAAAWKFDGIEMHLHSLAKINRDDVLRWCGKYNLSISTLGTGMMAVRDGLTLTNPNPAIQARTLNVLKEYINLAEEFNSAVTLGFLNGNFGISDVETRKKLRTIIVNGYRETADYAAKHNVTLLCEPLNRYECDWLNTITEGLELIEDVGYSNVKLLCDTFHANIEEADIISSLEEAGEKIAYVHLADSNRQAPGRGHGNLEQVFNTLERIKYNGWLGMEILPIPDPETAAKQGCKKIQEWQLIKSQREKKW